MKVTMNNIEYTTSASEGTTTISYNTGSFSTGTMNEEEALKFVIVRDIRTKRDKLLSESDWRDLPSYPNADQPAWRAYRQELRDLPSTYIQGQDLILPTKP